MEYHAVIEKSEGWWIGWLIDLPGVNAQERTREELLESLRIGASDMLDLKGIHDPNVEIVDSSAANNTKSPMTIASSHLSQDNSQDCSIKPERLGN